MAALGHQVPFTSVGGEPCCCNTPDGPPYCFTEYTTSINACEAQTLGGHYIQVPESISKRLTSEEDPNNAQILWPVAQGELLNFSPLGKALRIGVRISTRLQRVFPNGTIGSYAWSADLGVPNQTQSYQAGNWCNGAILITRESTTAGTIKDELNNSSVIQGNARLRCYMFNMFARKARYNENPELVTSCGNPFANPPVETNVYWVAGELGRYHQCVAYLETPWFRISSYPLTTSTNPPTPDQITWNSLDGLTPTVFYPWMTSGVFDANLAEIGRTGDKAEVLHFEQTDNLPWPQGDIVSERKILLTDQDMRGVPFLTGSVVAPAGSFTRITTLFNKKDIVETVDEPADQGGFAYFLPFPNPPP